MPAELFVDTSGWFPLVHNENPAHGRVAQALRNSVQKKRRIVTTNLVIAETHALIMRRIHRTAAIAFLREVSRSPNIVISSTPEYEAAAEADWLSRYTDHDFSVTDAVSFAVMSDRNIREALGLGQHFIVAGFCLLPSPP